MNESKLLPIEARLALQAELQSMRTNRGAMQIEIADALGVSQQVVNKIVNHAQVGLEIADQIYTALGTTGERLLAKHEEAIRPLVSAHHVQKAIKLLIADRGMGSPEEIAIAAKTLLEENEQHTSTLRWARAIERQVRRAQEATDPNLARARSKPISVNRTLRRDEDPARALACRIALLQGVSVDVVTKVSRKRAAGPDRSVEEWLRLIRSEAKSQSLREKSRSNVRRSKLRLID